MAMLTSFNQMGRTGEKPVCSTMTNCLNSNAAATRKAQVTEQHWQPQKGEQASAQCVCWEELPDGVK